MSKVFRLQNSYRQRNCEAILEVTGEKLAGLVKQAFTLSARPQKVLDE